MTKVFVGLGVVVVALLVGMVVFAAQPEKPEKMPTLAKVTVAVTGFHCQACPDELQLHLAKLDGVTEVKATLKPAQVTATLDEAKITSSQFVNAIATHPTAMDKKQTYGAALLAYIDTAMCAEEETMCQACFTEIPKALKTIKGIHNVTLDTTGKIASISFPKDAKVTTVNIADALLKHNFKFTAVFTAPVATEATPHGHHEAH